jgi:phage repressor protein C with HTH and peptisase S24 domain
MLNSAIPSDVRVIAYMKPRKPSSPTQRSVADTTESKHAIEFRERLAAVLQMNGVSPRRGIPKLHERLPDVSLSTARKLVAGEGYPRAETMAAMQRELGVSIDWLLGGVGSPLLNSTQKRRDNLWDAIVFIKLAQQTSGSEEIVLVPGLRDPKTLQIHKVSGDAMAPDLMDGDYVLVSTAVSAIEPDAIYLMQGRGGLVFRRLEESIAGAGWRLVPRNPKMHPEHVPGVALPGQPRARSLVEVIGKAEKKIFAKI